MFVEATLCRQVLVLCLPMRGVRFLRNGKALPVKNKGSGMRPFPHRGSKSGADRVQENVPRDFAGRLRIADHMIVIPFLPEITDA